MTLLEVLSDKFKPQHNETVLSLQYCKLTREQNENAEDWMVNLIIKENEYGTQKKTEGLMKNSLTV